ncbi:MAG: DUF6519 domain-containing protein [Jatrophihabitantaceae bacterium]
MHGDFSRLSFNPENHYTAVWAQQGRVQLDSDANELTAILLAHLRSLTVDLIGPFGTGYPGSGFAVGLDPNDPDDLLITPGYYYVHGLRCTLTDSTGSEPAKPIRYRGQAGVTGVPPLPHAPFLVELLVWEQTISAVMAPELAEPGLGPSAPDTTLRSQLRFVITVTEDLPDGAELAGDESPAQLQAAYLAYNTVHPHRPQLRARTRFDDPDDAELAGLPTATGYRRAENQLYRVEVRSPGDRSTATFAWSRDNGSVLFALSSLAEGEAEQTVAQLTQPPRDDQADLAEGDWVELRDDSWTPTARPRPLLQVVRYDRARGLVTLAGPEDFDPHRIDDSARPYLRRWDQQVEVDTADNAIEIPGTDAWYELEDGVQVQFCSQQAHYRTGDYWLIPARNETGSVLWPVSPLDGQPQAVTAYRPPLYRAPLAMITSSGVVDLRVRLAAIGPAEDGETAPAGPAPDETVHVPVMAPSVGAVVDAAPPALVRLTVLPYADSQPEGSKVVPGTTFDLGETQQTIGRTAGNQIMLADPTVSRSHAVIAVKPGQAVIWETGSDQPDHPPAAATNGTFVNERRITSSTPLASGDVIRLGAVQLAVSFLDPSMAPASP